ncbi:MAG: VWA domain-containing protein [Chloroflexi bacterium]|nr:VWA domain-containing protein [Chloroflexota bacterium]
MLFRYRAWDGSQQIDPITAEELLDALAEDVLENDDIESALQRLLRYGDQGRLDNRLEGIQRLLEQLRQQRKAQQERYNLGSIMDDIAKRLDHIVEQERSTVEERLQRVQSPDQPEKAGEQPPVGSSPSSDLPLSEQSPTQQDSESPSVAERSSAAADEQRLKDMLRRLSSQKQQFLDQLPRDVGGRIRRLQDYEFLNQQARQEFEQLLNELRAQMAQQYFQGLQEAIQSMTPEMMQQMRDMVRDLNQLLDEALDGKQPDASEFLKKYGQFFPGAQNLQDILDQMQQRASQMQSLMNSLSREQKGQLQSMLDSLFRDDRLQWDLARLAATMNQLFPRDNRRYRFSGDESLALQDALELMQQLGRLDMLEQQLQRAQHSGLDAVDPQLVEQALGPQARQGLDQLNQITQLLEDAGFIKRRGHGWELTARAVRRIGQKALREIFADLKKDRLGNHETTHSGLAGERGDDTKVYEFGDPFLLNLQATLRNAIVRTGPGTPIRLQPDDFEVFRTEHRTEVSTVLMIDLSRSMLYSGCYVAAKRVVLALNALIQMQYPRDSLYIVGFADRARQLQPEDLSSIDWGEERFGTNLQHGLMLARRLLSRHTAGTRQVIVITDGEPTAHIEADGQVMFHYPPTWRTYEETIREVVRCTRDRVIINTFMLERGRYLTEFIEQITRINRGRAFFATPERLGEYILVDYVRNKRKRVS